jgi:hypothetical protein
MLPFVDRDARHGRSPAETDRIDRWIFVAATVSSCWVLFLTASFLPMPHACHQQQGKFDKSAERDGREG